MAPPIYGVDAETIHPLLSQGTVYEQVGTVKASAGPREMDSSGHSTFHQEAHSGRTAASLPFAWKSQSTPKPAAQTSLPPQNISGSRSRSQGGTFDSCSRF